MLNVNVRNTLRKYSGVGSFIRAGIRMLPKSPAALTATGAIIGAGVSKPGERMKGAALGAGIGLAGGLARNHFAKAAHKMGDDIVGGLKHVRGQEAKLAKWAKGTRVPGKNIFVPTKKTLHGYKKITGLENAVKYNKAAIQQMKNTRHSYLRYKRYMPVVTIGASSGAVMMSPFGNRPKPKNKGGTYAY